MLYAGLITFWIITTTWLIVQAANSPGDRYVNRSMGFGLGGFFFIFFLSLVVIQGSTGDHPNIMDKHPVRVDAISGYGDLAYVGVPVLSERQPSSDELPQVRIKVDGEDVELDQEDLYVTDSKGGEVSGYYVDPKSYYPWLLLLGSTNEYDREYYLTIPLDAVRMEP